IKSTPVPIKTMAPKLLTSSKNRYDIAFHTTRVTKGDAAINITSKDARPATCAPNQPRRRWPIQLLTLSKIARNRGRIDTQSRYQANGETKQEESPVSAMATVALWRRAAT